MNGSICAAKMKTYSSTRWLGKAPVRATSALQYLSLLHSMGTLMERATVKTSCFFCVLPVFLTCCSFWGCGHSRKGGNLIDIADECFCIFESDRALVMPAEWFVTFLYKNCRTYTWKLHQYHAFRNRNNFLMPEGGVPAKQTGYLLRIDAAVALVLYECLV